MRLTLGEVKALLVGGGKFSFYPQTLYRRKHFSGLLLVKKTGTDTYRTLFSTHFGLSLFQRDFSVLLGLNLQAENKALAYTCTKPQNDTVYKLSTPGFGGYYRTSPETDRVQEIRWGPGLRKTTFHSLPGSTGQETIRIRHTGLRLSIGLDGIE